MKILIAGDLVPTTSNIESFYNPHCSRIIGDKLNSIWNIADYRVFNLETPLTDLNTPILKNGPNIHTPRNSIIGIKSLNPSLITLANNHIMDHDYQGLDSTLKILSDNNIPFIGAGKNIYEARNTYIINHKGIKIGFYNCTENEFSIASSNEPGANPFDPFESFDHVMDLRKSCDYVIVLFHGGKEHYRYPTPLLMKVCRKFADKGADIIIAQHSHCIGCYEKYNGSQIIYGQGNFIFDYMENDYWKTSLIIEIIINEGIELKYTPIIKQKNSIEVAEGIEKQKILNEFYKRSIEIQDNNFVELEYEKLVNKSIDYYLNIINGSTLWKMRIDKYLFNGRILNKSFNTKRLLALQNFIECETHREVILSGIKNLVRERRNVGKLKI